jgi:hypothetical protein
MRKKESRRLSPGLQGRAGGDRMVEVAGVEPASGNPQPSGPTCVVTDWDSPLPWPRVRPREALAPLESRPIPARRKNRTSPLLVTPTERRRRGRDGCLLKQREPTLRWQFWFCQLFYEPTGTSARTRRSHDPRRSRSPPSIFQMGVYTFSIPKTGRGRVASGRRCAGGAGTARNAVSAKGGNAEDDRS